MIELLACFGAWGGLGLIYNVDRPSQTRPKRKHGAVGACLYMCIKVGSTTDQTLKMMKRRDDGINFDRFRCTGSRGGNETESRFERPTLCCCAHRSGLDRQRSRGKEGGDARNGRAGLLRLCLVARPPPTHQQAWRDAGQSIERCLSGSIERGGRPLNNAAMRRLRVADE